MQTEKTDTQTAWDAAQPPEQKPPKKTKAKWRPANPGYLSPKLKVTDPLTLEGKAIPERRWAVQGWVPHGNVTMLAGDGGVGKTMLSQMLLTCVAIQTDWLGLKTTPCRAIGVFCEDDDAELQRRQEAINENFDIGFGELENFQWVSRVGEDNALMKWEQYETPGAPTEFFQQVHDWAQDFGAQLIVLDSLHDLFPGNEISRVHARQFIQLLVSLAQDCDGSVIINSHPSVAGRASGTGESGSTAWNNAVRSRLYLTRPDDEQGFDARDERVLSRKKANYAAMGDEVRMTWDSGVFVSHTAPSGILDSIDKRGIDSKFLELLIIREREGRPVSEKSRAGNYAPKEFAKHPDRAGYRKRDFEIAMERLFADKRIRVEEYKNKSVLCGKIVPVEQLNLGEK